MKKLLLPTLLLVLFGCDSGSQQPNVTDNKAAAPIADPKQTALDSLAKMKVSLHERYRADSIFYSGRTIKVTRISGKEKYGGKTKIAFKPLVEVIKEERAYDKAHMEPIEKTTAAIKAYIEEAVGGEIRLDVTRGTIGAADLEMFTIIVHDSTDTEVFRRKLDSDTPEVGDDDWWNVHLQMLPISVRPPFYVYVVDQLADQPIKFQVLLK